MALKLIQFANFRNFPKREFVFGPGVTVIVGPNASGKTNILEAIYLISSGKSFKARLEEEMILYDKEVGRVEASVEGTKLTALLTRGVITRGEFSQKTAKKRLLINGVGKRLVDFAGNLKTVIFRPQDMELVTESPSIRRKFLDGVLSQVDREYRRALLSFEKGLRRRNRVLFQIREEGASRTNLYFWDKLLIKNGEYLTQKREELINFINESQKLNDGVYKLVYDKSLITEARLLQYKREEVAAATTLVGPHRDDLIFFKNEKDLAKYGSRGEQRIGVLWVKIAELAFIEFYTKEKPTLLLDDIFSELDHEHRELITKIANNQQTILTTADPHYVRDLGEFEKIELT